MRSSRMKALTEPLFRHLRLPLLAETLRREVVNPSSSWSACWHGSAEQSSWKVKERDSSRCDWLRLLGAKHRSQFSYPRLVRGRVGVRQECKMRGPPSQDIPFDALHFGRDRDSDFFRY